MEQIEYLQQLQVMRLEPEDVIILHYPRDLTIEAAERLHQELKSHFPSFACMVIGANATLGVIRPSVSTDKET